MPATSESLYEQLFPLTTPYHHGGTRLCSIEDCKGKYEAKGYCDKHYQRLRLTGTVEKQPKRLCSLDDCDTIHYMKGYCIKHFRRYDKHGDPLKILHHIGKKCSIDNCDNDYCSKGLCQKHYNQTSKHKEVIKKWVRNNPEKVLNHVKTQLNKHLDFFNMELYEYRWALQAWSKSVKKRDNYICLDCGDKGIEAHHVLSKKDYPEFSLIPSNGITLCKPCHYEYTYGDKKCL